ncbi:MaoC/PaaZ C-terminal domain-containing protein [Amycolatopsis saalfeldensis]|uniref:Acyl dehydratase n=1 Tax=Amycolatopsis saalfeldensis TaxID=394193 RepID=A0A1H8Y6R3_9PSEU|nr:MaoC/PaaZ C-terminal domain-containing protein [Amycolatopsis saalfeldensis]SEP47772.1 Acyl dehydratase [Amycolatopsis saalfeldensis]
MTEGFDPAGLDRWTDESRFEVTRARLVEYAAATNDPIPAHRAGDVASPVFAIVPVFQSLLEPALEVVPAGLFGRVVHGEQDFRFHRPIRPGDKLVSRAKMTGYEGLPNGTRGTVYLETRDEAGEPVNEQYVTLFVRGFDTGETRGTLGPDHRSARSGAPAAKVAQHVDDDQTFRYGPAAGDPMPIHLDAEVARAAGLPGIIAHGLCTMAFASWALLTSVGERRRLRRLAVRFAKPVLPGEDLDTTIWRAGALRYAFETTVGDTVVLKDGLAEFAEQE